MKIFKPYSKWVLVRPIEEENDYGSNFVTADDPNKKPQIGEVISGADFKKGNKIFFQRNGSVALEVNEEKLILVNQNQILGLYE